MKANTIFARLWIYLLSALMLLSAFMIIVYAAP